jgi:hypothetical protein
MKSLLFLTPLLFTFGCTGMSGVVKQLKNDPATVVVHVNTIYGTLSFQRVGVLRTNQTETVSPDGTITVGVAK